MGSSKQGEPSRWLGRDGAPLICAAIAAAALLAGGGAALTDRISDRLLRQDAEAAAMAWAADLSTNLPDLPALIERRMPTPEARARLAMARGVGGVFRYKAYDRSGGLVFVSDNLERIGSEAVERDLAAHRNGSRLAAQILAGGTHVEASRGTPPHRPAYNAEAYMPVRRGDAMLGVVEVYVDQTAQRARYSEAFLLTEALTGALILAAGLLSLGMVWRQARARRDADARQAFLAREVDHRAKNALAVVLSVLKLTPKGDPDSYARAVEGRVAALARAHALLAEGAWAGTGLRVLAERGLAPFTGDEPADHGGAVAVLEGPPVPLGPVAVQPLAVVLHELATNAAKHGALSSPGGRVRLSWRIEDEVGLLRLRWAESGGPPVAGPPVRRGFGSKAIDATVRAQLGCKAAFAWSPSGLCVDLDLPLAHVLAPGGPAPSPLPLPPPLPPRQDAAPRVPAPMPAPQRHTAPLAADATPEPERVG
jgi:two-component sensor histidine kinase